MHFQSVKRPIFDFGKTHVGVALSHGLEKDLIEAPMEKFDLGALDVGGEVAGGVVGLGAAVGDAGRAGLDEPCGLAGVGRGRPRASVFKVAIECVLYYEKKEKN